MFGCSTLCYTTYYIQTVVSTCALAPSRGGWGTELLGARLRVRLSSGGRLCTLIGVPCRLSMLSTFSTSANLLFQYKSPRAEGAKTDPPPGFTYEGTQTTE